MVSTTFYGTANFETESQVREEEASHPTTREDCHSLRRPPGNNSLRSDDLYKIGKTPQLPSDMDPARGNKNHLPLEGQRQDPTQEKVNVLKNHNNATFQVVPDHVHVLLPWPPVDGQPFVDRRTKRGWSVTG